MVAAPFGRILVVEDEVITLKAIRECLTKAGYLVIDDASSGLEAIQKAISLEPDLILMDIRLEGDVDGVMATQRIKARLNVPILYLTAHSDSETLKRVLHSRPDGYIVKPFRDEELVEAIRQAIDRYRDEGS